MKEVDADRFAGRWYQMLRKRNPEDFGDCSFAEYTQIKSINENNESAEVTFDL